MVASKRKPAFKFEPSWGLVTDRIAEGIQLSKRLNRRVHIRLNGLTVKANKHLSVRHLTRQYCLMQDARCARYSKSPAAIEMRREMDESRLKMQADCDWCAANLPTIVDFLPWMKRYLPGCDRIGVNRHIETVVNYFESLGYGTTEGDIAVGTPNPTHQQRIDSAISQMLNGLKTYGCVHQMVLYCVEQLLEEKS